MSNVFINRNRSQGAYKTQILNQKIMDANQTWYAAAKKYKAAKPGTKPFYMTSLRYGANLDL